MRFDKLATISQVAILAGLAAVVEHADLLPSRWRLVTIVAIAAVNAIVRSPIRP